MTSNAIERREAVARMIGSFVVYDDHGGPDTEVLADVIGPNYDENTRRVYALTDAILATINPGEGWVLVPREPTPEMLKAASAEEDRCAVHNYGGHPSSEDLWAAMISAAPQPTGGGGDEPRLTAHQGQLLGEALGKVLIHVGMLRADAEMTGPELLLAADTFMEAPPEASGGGDEVRRLREALELAAWQFECLEKTVKRYGPADLAPSLNEASTAARAALAPQPPLAGERS